MTVYWEYAFVENFLLDYLLLYLAVKCSRGRVSVWRLVLAALIGSGEALLFPVLAMPPWCSYLVKFLGGALIAICAVADRNRKSYVVTVAMFFLFTFALGGLLTAVYSFFGIEYVEGRGYLVESIPVSLLLSASGLFAIACLHGIKTLTRIQFLHKHTYPCTLKNGSHTIRCNCFADSGNFVTFHERPVCVITAVAALALFKGAKPIGRVTMTTISGKKESPVFRCESFQIESGGKRITKRGVLFTVGEIKLKNCPILLHTSFMEELYANFVGAEMLVAKD